MISTYDESPSRPQSAYKLSIRAQIQTSTYNVSLQFFGSGLPDFILFWNSSSCQTRKMQAIQNISSLNHKHKLARSAVRYSIAHLHMQNFIHLPIVQNRLTWASWFIRTLQAVIPAWNWPMMSESRIWYLHYLHQRCDGLHGYFHLYFCYFQGLENEFYQNCDTKWRQAL